MRKLLRANFSRLKKDKAFLFSCFMMFLAGLFFPVFHYVDNLKNGAGWTADSSVFVYTYLAPVLLSLVCALFVGCEYSDGTMRNKLIAGHRRYLIYLSQLIVCSVAGGLLCVAYLVPHICLGLPLLGGFVAAPGELLLRAALTLALIVAFSALFVAVAMLCRNRAYSTAACILLVFVLLFVGIRITAALSEPEYYSGYSYTENGITISEEETRNPNYPHGAKREIYEFLNAFLPGGQMIRLANTSAELSLTLALYNGVILLAASGIGLVLFRRKDLK